MVYVLDIEGKPLMPTTRHGKVRRLLKQGKADVVELCPFTIRLKYKTKSYKQDITLGVDAGTVHIGLSATSKSKELYSSEIILRNDIVDLISTRKESRRTRRNRLRYRKARFNNRIKSKKNGWVAPSVRCKIESHINAINNVYSILPISKIVVEVSQFDIQKIKNPDISGKEYQQGEQLGFWNVREYVLARDGHKCQHCKGKSKDVILNVHHIESRKTGGNSPSNLITLCETCHKAYHRGEFKLNIKRSISLRDAAVMGIMKWELYNTSDAFTISKNFEAKRLGYCYKIKLTRRHNRQIHKAKILKGGKKKNNQAPFEVNGFRLFDRVKYEDKIMFVASRRISGKFVIRDIDYGDKHELSYKKLKLERVKRNMIQIKTE